MDTDSTPLDTKKFNVPETNSSNANINLQSNTKGKNSPKLLVASIAGLAILTLLISGSVAYTKIKDDTSAKENNKNKATKQKVQVVENLDTKNSEPNPEDFNSNKLDDITGTDATKSGQKITPTPTISSDPNVEVKVLDNMMNNVNTDDFGSKQMSDL